MTARAERAAWEAEVQALADADPFEYKCNGCEALFNGDDVTSPTYECSRCGTQFTRDDSADGDSNRCASCNVFAAKVSEVACPECGGSGDDVEEGEFRPPPPLAPEEQAKEDLRQEEARERSRALHQQILAEEDAKREAIRARWSRDGEDIARSLAKVRPELADEVRDYFTADWVGPGSHFMLSAGDAAKAARLLLGMPRGEWDRHAPIEQRKAEGERLAAAGIEHYDERWSWSSQATGVSEPGMAELARRLAK